MDPVTGVEAVDQHLPCVLLAEASRPLCFVGRGQGHCSHVWHWLMSLSKSYTRGLVVPWSRHSTWPIASGLLSV